MNVSGPRCVLCYMCAHEWLSYFSVCRAKAGHRLVWDVHYAQTSRKRMRLTHRHCHVLVMNDAKLEPPSWRLWAKPPSWVSSLNLHQLLKLNLGLLELTDDRCLRAFVLSRVRVFGLSLSRVFQATSRCRTVWRAMENIFYFLLLAVVGLFLPGAEAASFDAWRRRRVGLGPGDWHTWNPRLSRCLRPSTLWCMRTWTKDYCEESICGQNVVPRFLCCFSFLLPPCPSNRTSSHSRVSAWPLLHVWSTPEYMRFFATMKLYITLNPGEFKLDGE